MTILRLLVPLGIPYALYVAIPPLVPAGMPPWAAQAARLVAVAVALAACIRHYRRLPWRAPQSQADSSAKKRRAVFCAAATAVAALALWAIPFAAILAAKAGEGVTGGLVARANAVSVPYPVGIAYSMLRLANSVLLAPLAEELLFRAHIQPWLLHASRKNAEGSSGGPVGTALAALDDAVPAGFFDPAVGLRCEIPAAILFALGHLPAEYPSALLYYALTAWLYRKTRSLGACVAVHAAVNAGVGALAMTGFNFIW